MTILKKRPVAIAIAVVVCLAAFFLSGRGGLSSRRDQVEAVFYTGVNGDGLCIFSDLNTRLDSAYNIATVVRRNDKSNHALIELDGAYASMQKALEGSDLRKMTEADKALGNAVETVYRYAQNIEMSETDAALVSRQYRSFMSAADTISYDPYNSLAREFNSENSGFPASLFGVKDLEYFY